jgi:ribosomal protein L37AE/L43A
MALEEDWSVKVRMADSGKAYSLVGRLRSAGREAGRFGPRVSVVAGSQQDAQALAAEIESAHLRSASKCAETRCEDAGLGQCSGISCARSFPGVAAVSPHVDDGEARRLLYFHHGSNATS